MATAEPLVVHVYTCERCSFKAKDEDTLSEHIKKKHVSKVIGYQCFYCPEVFQAREEALTHCSALHNNTPDNSKIWRQTVIFSCDTCKVNISDKSNLISHSLEAHCGNHLYKCEICLNYTTDKNHNLIQHKKDAHNVHSKVFSCPLCLEYPSAFEIEIKAHILSDHWTRKAMFHCNQCTYVCERNIEQHVLKHRKSFSCSFNGCSKYYKSPAALFQHIMDSHCPNIVTWFQCQYCYVEMDSTHKLEQHVKDKHYVTEEYDEEDDRYLTEIECNLCTNDYKCEKKKTFSNHMNTKHPRIQMTCPYKPCNYRTLYFWKFTKHVYDEHICSEVVNLVCPECNDCFGKVHSMVQHLNDKHDETSYCSHCDDYFPNLLEHFEDVSHTELSVLNCQLCDFSVPENIADGPDFWEHLKNQHNIVIDDLHFEMMDDN